MTLTFDVLNAARRVLWIVTGADKQAALAGLVAGDPAIVGSRISRSAALVLADADAAALVRDR
jgi:6-phosphogluconolactonase